MKRILIPTMGTRGDIQPYILLAKALNKSGFTATIASHPCWRNLVAENSIDFKPIGPDIDIEYEAAVIRGKSNNWMLGAIKTMRFMFRIIEDSSNQIKQLCSTTDLVVASHSHIGAAEADTCGIPYISVTLQPGFIPKILEPKSRSKIIREKLSGLLINPLMVEPYNKLRKKHHLKPVKSFYDLLSPKLNIIPISPVIYPPDRFWEDKNKMIGYWFEEDYPDYTPSAELERFINSGASPIIVSLGAMSFESGEETNKLDILVKAISRTGKRAIIQGFNKTLQTYALPDNMMKIGSVPHSWLFKHAYCVIHHGGFGTTASALIAGVPSIVIPHVLDQYLWADKIYKIKAGTKPINAKGLSEEALMAAINSLNENYEDILSSTRALSKKINSENGLAETVAYITEILNV